MRPDPEQVSAGVFAALADTNRRAILASLAEFGPSTATELSGRLSLTRQGIAKHLGLLADAGLRPALNAIHREPARPWQLEELARESAMSRSSFAARFRAAAGEPPVSYLNRWRIRLAQKALRDTDTTVAQLASELGYASESSFSHAFKRITAVSPRGYRSRERAAPSPLATRV